ncbi:hypothetical protein L4C33_19600 [Vibrio makurazakiensis]|uniref:hypothetical protein n=1 Tax=Vibrio makurazakiensis TaxID=2910250 RepID=UPI003D0EB0E9
MTILTVFFCGTGSNSEDNNHKNYASGELISTLAKNAQGRDLIDYIQVDGVGSGNRSEWLKQAQDDTYSTIRGSLQGKGIDSNMRHVMNILRGTQSGNNDYQTRAENMLEDVRPSKSIWPFSNSQKYNDWLKETNTLALDLKHGLSSRHANIALARRNSPISQVNIVGWSRGGVSCFELANRMLKDNQLSHIPVNIFACDPVPGGLNSFKDYKKLGKNVKQLVCLFAEDERSLAFKARMPRLDRNTKYYTSMMPGRHATLVGNAHTSGGSKGSGLLTGPGLVTRDFMEKVLTGWGTKLKQGSTLNFSGAKLLELYEQMRSHQKHFDAMHSMTYTLKNRIFWTDKDRIGQQRERRFGIPMYRFQFPGIANDYGDAINRHHCDVMAANDFAIKGKPSAFPRCI